MNRMRLIDVWRNDSIVVIEYLSKLLIMDYTLKQCNRIDSGTIERSIYPKHAMNRGTFIEKDIVSNRLKDNF